MEAWVRPLSRPHRPFLGPLAAILDFAGGAALQAVSERPLRRYAGIKKMFSGLYKGVTWLLHRCLKVVTGVIQNRKWNSLNMK